VHHQIETLLQNIIACLRKILSYATQLPWHDNDATKQKEIVVSSKL
jgi:hypothetical protein